jgi:hypothetical protein
MRHPRRADSRRERARSDVSASYGGWVRAGWARSWLARDERLECDVALKFLQERFRWDEAALLALRTETRRTRELNHPGIVRIHDLHEGEGQTAIAMEFLPGGSLHAQRCRRDPAVFTPAEILVWLPQLCAALDHAHASGVVHRDLKPSNLLLAVDGSVKIGDFGIAQPLAESALRISQWAPSGTLAYMGPQQHFGEATAPSDDIYSLGATLYELLTGKPPFYSGNLAAQIERRLPDSLTERRRQLGLGHLEPLTAEWERSVAACLAKQAEDRPRSASAVLAMVLDATRGDRRSLRFLDRPRRTLATRPARLGLGALGLAAAWLSLEFGRSPPEPAAQANPAGESRTVGAEPASTSAASGRVETENPSQRRQPGLGGVEPRRGWTGCVGRGARTDWRTGHPDPGPLRAHRPGGLSERHGGPAVARDGADRLGCGRPLLRVRLGSSGPEGGPAGRHRGLSSGEAVRLLLVLGSQPRAARVRHRADADG